MTDGSTTNSNTQTEQILTINSCARHVLGIKKMYEDEYTESEFEGTYVHDVEGWSDDDIYDVLDGEPDAYWNID